MDAEKKVVKKVVKKPATVKKVVAAKKPAAIKKVVAAKKPAIKKPTTKKTVNITLIKSFHGRLPAHRATVTGLGLKRINHTVSLADTPEVRGMINKISYLLKVED